MEQKIVSHDEWLSARKELLIKEKQFSAQRDALSAARRALPMEKVTKEYSFEGPSGRVSLRDLFGRHPQLIVYHFMFDPTKDAGCNGCSFVADNFSGAILHLGARDTAFAVVSRAPLAKIEPFKERMGWSFPWFSSFDSEFNYDYQASVRQEDMEAGTAEYNYAKRVIPGTEAPGISVFAREGDDIFHSYSTYGRGLDLLMNTYNYLDLTPLGRHEAGLPFSMAWVKHHDKYE